MEAKQDERVTEEEDSGRKHRKQKLAMSGESSNAAALDPLYGRGRGNRDIQPGFERRCSRSVNALLVGFFQSQGRNKAIPHCNCLLE